MTRRTAYTVMIIASLTLAVINLHVFVMHHLGTLPGKLVACKVDETKYQFWGLNVIPWIDLVLYAILPSFIILICNAVIVCALMRSKKKALGKGDTSVQKSFNKIIPMLLLVSTVFVVCSLPVGGYIICKLIICSLEKSSLLFLDSFLPFEYSESETFWIHPS